MATRPDEVEARRSIAGGQAALVVLGLVVLLAALWFLFLRGDAEEPLAIPPTTTPAPTPEATEEAPTKPRKGPIETFEVFAPKDPFRPLISEATTDGSATVGGVPAAPGSGTTDGQPSGQPSGGSDISDGSDGDSVGGHRVRLVDTFTRDGEPQARVQVDGTVYTVGEGERFADNFEVLSISGECASLLFGDDQFSLCEGEEILK
jgi:hypothetical protein